MKLLFFKDGSAGSDDSEDETMEDEMMADAKKPEGSDEELEEEDEGGLDAVRCFLL